jgi:hypothetical protein
MQICRRAGYPFFGRQASNLQDADTGLGHRHVLFPDEQSWSIRGAVTQQSRRPGKESKTNAG